MSAEIDRDLLFCLQALQLGLVSQPRLREIGRGWDVSAPGMRAHLLAQAVLSEADVALLDRSVDLLIQARGGDARAAVDALGGAARIAESLAEDLRLEATLPRTEDKNLKATLAREGRLASVAEAPATPEARGRYGLRGELGRGGIGRVLVAFDEHVGREVAVKELLLGADPGSKSSGPQSAGARFLREARLTAQLEHPSIVPVYEVGRREDGTLYYTMRVVRGQTLATALRSCGSVDERLRLLHHFGDLCGAVAFAHSRGVLHRDLKPHNVMIGEFNETVLLDWGLAKLRDAKESENRRFAEQMEAMRQIAAGATVEGAAMGTPEYMPPEQAFGELDKIGEASDVYALGAVLYELLAGRPPFSGKHGVEALLKVQRYGQGKEELVRVRKIAPDAPADLAAVAEKALFPQVHGRYPSAKALLDEINAWQAGRRVSAYRYTWLERLARAVEQNKAVTGLLAALFVVLVTGALGLFVSARQARDAERRTHWDLGDAFAEKAARLAEQKDFLGARVFAAAALQVTPSNPLGDYPDPSTFGTPQGDAVLASVQSTLWTAHHLGTARHAGALRGAAGSVEVARFSPDGRRLATGGMGRALTVWDVAARRALQTRAVATPVTTLAWSPDGGLLVYGAGEKVMLWRTGTAAEPAGVAEHKGGVTAVALSPDGATLVTAGRDRALRLWSLPGGARAGDLPVPPKMEGYLERLSFSADGQLLAAGGTGGGVFVWDLAARRLSDTLEGHEGGVVGLAFSPKGNSLSILGADRTVRMWVPALREEVVVVSLGEGAPKGLAVRFEADDRTLFAVGREETVELWDPQDGERVGVLRGHSGQVRTVAFAADGKTLATAGVDGRINLWEVAPRAELTRLAGHQGTISALALSADGKRIVSASRDRTVRQWDLASQRDAGHWKAHESEIMAMAVAPGGEILTGARNGELRLWRADGQKALADLQPEGAGMVLSLSVALGGRVAASAGLDATVQVWDLAERRLLRALEGHTDTLSAVCFSPDGASLASGGRDRTVRIWETATGAARATFSHPERVRALAFSPDGRWLAVSDQARTVTLLEAATGTPGVVLRGHHDAPRALAFSRDGRLLATAGGSDGTVRLWELPGGRLLQVVDLGDDVRAAAFAPGDATLLASGGPTIALTPVRLDLWKRDPRALLEEAQRDAAMRLERFTLEPLDAAR